MPRGDRLHAAREDRHVVAARERGVDQMPAEKARAAQNQESHAEWTSIVSEAKIMLAGRTSRPVRGSAAARECAHRAYARGTIATPASFSCASTSEATYLSPNPSRFAVTRLWCTASPTMHGTGSDSARCV